MDLPKSIPSTETDFYQMGRADLKSLCEVLKRLNAVSTPYLYESVTISTAELSMAGLISTVENIPFAGMKYTKDIWIQSSFPRTADSSLPSS